MQFALLFTLVLTAFAVASPIQDVDQYSQTEALQVIDQVAALNDLTQGEAIDLLAQYAAENGIELSEQDAEFLPALAASVALPFVAKGVGALVKKVAPKSAKVVDTITGFL